MAQPVSHDRPAFIFSTLVTRVYSDTSETGSPPRRWVDITSMSSILQRHTIKPSFKDFSKRIQAF